MKKHLIKSAWLAVACVSIGAAAAMFPMVFSAVDDMARSNYYLGSLKLFGASSTITFLVFYSMDAYVRYEKE